MERSSDGGEAGKRSNKRVKPGMRDVVGDNEDDGGLEKTSSFRDKLLGIEQMICSKDKRGSSVFDEAWKDYIDGLKGFFGNGPYETKEQGRNGMEDEDWPMLVVSQEEYELWCAPWRKLLIVKLLGKKIPFRGLNTSLERLWKTKKPFKIRDLDNSFFVISFEDEEDMNYVYQEGPWMISDHYLVVQRWRPNFDPCNAEYQRKIAVWIRIPLLPLELFNAASLRKIGSLIGRPLKIDMITHSSDRGRFARICVEIDLQRKLKPGITVFGMRRVVEYEGLHLICFHCGKFGHHRDACPEKCNVRQGTYFEKGMAVQNESRSSSEVPQGGKEGKEEGNHEGRMDASTGGEPQKLRGKR